MEEDYQEDHLSHRVKRIIRPDSTRPMIRRACDPAPRLKTYRPSQPQFLSAKAIQLRFRKAPYVSPGRAADRRRITPGEKCRHDSF